MKKNILIFGEPRSGKSTLSDMVFKKFGYQIIRSDCERNAIKEVFPDLNINPKNAINSKSFQLYLKQLIFQYWRDGRDKIGEGCDTSPDDCNELFNDGNNNIIYLGAIDITPEDLAKNIKENDTEFDWTRNRTLEELIVSSKNYIDKAKKYKEQCQKMVFFL